MLIFISNSIQPSLNTITHIHYSVLISVTLIFVSSIVLTAQHSDLYIVASLKFYKIVFSSLTILFLMHNSPVASCHFIQSRLTLLVTSPEFPHSLTQFTLNTPP